MQRRDHSCKRETGAPFRCRGVGDMSGAQARHAGYYVALIERNTEDWQTIAAELPQIRRAWEAVADNDELALAFALAMHWFHDVQGMWQEAIRWKTRGAQAARILKRGE